MWRQLGKFRRWIFIGLLITFVVWVVLWTGLERSTDVARLAMLKSKNTRMDRLEYTAGKINEPLSGACDLTEDELKQYPSCFGKLTWMLGNWRSDPCYAAHGVDGSLCSCIRYLNKVEGWCPGPDGHQKVTHPYKPEKAAINTDLEGLMWLLRDKNARASFSWIRMRIKRMWPKWTAAITSLAKKQNLENRLQKRILIHIGMMTNQSGTGFVENQFKGGPLGEFVQWSDVISSLYLLGHRLIITSEVEDLPGSLDQPLSRNDSCRMWRKPPVDIVYTDIIGLGQVTTFVRDSCVLRLVDSFGTEPAFNHKNYAEKHNLTTFWGQRNLNPRQFGTMFPHTPDNTFIGFVVERHIDDVKARDIIRKNQALVYGKNAYMWSGRNEYIRVFNESGLEVHGTVRWSPDEAWPKEVPDYVINHGVLKGEDLHFLLRQSKIFIGLGFPYEGPAPLEAIANGCVFINPLYPDPRDRNNNDFFKGKPTQRKVFSQNDYAFRYIGEPFVYTVNIDDLDIVRNTVKKILSNFPTNASLPYEYTEEGMLQRMNAFTEHQEFCAPDKVPPSWPPESAVHIVFGEVRQACNDVCWEKGYVCEPSYFKTINSKEALEKHHVTCTAFATEEDIFYPARHVNASKCTLQADGLLFSCAGGHVTLQRLCPCRTFIKGQTALCPECVT